MRILISPPPPESLESSSSGKTPAFSSHLVSIPISTPIWNAEISAYSTVVKTNLRHSFCVLMLAGLAIGQQPSYRYDTAGITLHGTLTERKVYGPPGYGETPDQDAHETILILKLPQPISVGPTADGKGNGSPNLDPAKNVREVQLFMSRPQTIEVRKFLGQMVIATGTLNESITASQRTKVWLDVKTITWQSKW
jgi:hypothetical protein